VASEQIKLHRIDDRRKIASMLSQPTSRGGMMFTRSALAAALALSVLVAPLAAEAQQAARVVRVGVLASGTTSAMATALDAFRQGMRELGYVEGQNTTMEYRWAEGRLDRLPALAGELVSVNTGPTLLSHY